jgi:hypothetical protein
MSAQTLTITYSQESVTADQWMRMEQQPVSSNRLTAADLQAMLALVQSGTSARAYKPPGCEASVLADQVVADLTLKVWPSSLELPYTLAGDLVTVGAKYALQEWHEFDLIIPMADRVELPYLCEGVTVTWQTPAYTRQGVEIQPPAITTSPTGLRMDAEVFGVLRIRCLALGWSHPLRFAMAKTDAIAITSLKPAVTLTWAGGDERLDLKLPGCLEALLAFCPDATSKRARALSTVDNEDDELVPVVYWSPCSGRMLAMRMERP